MEPRLVVHGRLAYLDLAWAYYTANYNAYCNSHAWFFIFYANADPLVSNMQYDMPSYSA